MGLLSFDSNPVIYFLAGYFLAFVLALIVYLSATKRIQRTENIFLGLSALLLIAMRLPVILFNRELNADESQMLTQAMTLAKDPVYWRSVDGTTGGPLGSYFLTIVGWFTGSYNYITGHSAALILVLITLYCFFRAMRNWFGPVTAMAAAYAIVLFYAFNQQEDFVHYSSEHVPVAIMGIVLFLISKLEKSQPQNGTFVLIGSLLALLPFGKLQTLPMVASLGVWMLYVIWQRKDFIREGLLFIAGGVGTLLIFEVATLTAGVYDDFVTYYIVGNFQYGGDVSWWANILALPVGLTNAPPVLWFLLAQCVVLILFITYPRKRSGKFETTVFALLWLGFTLLAISRTGSGYLHYWLFALLPIGVLSASMLSDLINSPNAILTFCVVSLASIAVPKAFAAIRKQPLNAYPSDAGSNRYLPFSKVAKGILKYGKPGEGLVVWGWNCQFYVETQMPQSVAENHSIRSIFSHPMQQEYLQRYEKNIRENKPVVVVDAVGKNSLWTQDKATQGIPAFPLLYKTVSANYVLADTVDDARIYVRKDRLGTR